MRVPPFPGRGGGEIQNAGHGLPLYAYSTPARGNLSMGGRKAGMSKRAFYASGSLGGLSLAWWLGRFAACKHFAQQYVLPHGRRSPHLPFEKGGDPKTKFAKLSDLFLNSLIWTHPVRPGQ